MRLGFWAGTGGWSSRAALCKMPPCRPWGRPLLHGATSPGVGTCQACSSSRLVGLHPGKEGGQHKPALKGLFQPR